MYSRERDRIEAGIRRRSVGAEREVSEEAKAVQIRAAERETGMLNNEEYQSIESGVATVSTEYRGMSNVKWRYSVRNRAKKILQAMTDRVAGKQVTGG